MTQRKSLRDMMRPLLGVRVSACCAILALILAVGQAAEETSLVGATRDQVLARFGEPRSQIVAGNREVMFFARDRITLRDGIVIETERLPTDTPRSAPPPAPSADAPPPSASAERSDAPVAPVAPGSGMASQSSSASAGTATPPPPKQVQADTPATPPEPKFEIKSVRPPSANGSRAARSGASSATKATAPATPSEAVRTSPAAAPLVAVTPESTASAVAQAPASAGASGVRQSGVVPVLPTSTPPVAMVAPPSETPESKPEAPSAAETEKEQKAKPAKKKSTRRRSPSEPDIPDAGDIISTRGNWFIVFAVTGIGVGYLLWRNRQRQLALAATAVSRTPFAAPVAAKSGATFSAELLQKLEWKRFEELVSAYYSKTGVVAVRTKSGPNAPVHIKISWKGEPRPFAYVQCIAQPLGLIDAKPLQELVNVLAADDIRRGYVVSTGKFNVSARDLAEEKHITLLPGDIFLEKLNALPDAARSELMQQITTGDYTTPTCPKCDARMVRSSDDPTMWRCPVHSDQQIPARG